ncbi:MAG TPA: hypothetical protein PK762_14350, partial [Candidatus Kapabacteria bacterium]|nr:hypothetical protein [Candidatus Kapabacteria bacterium]
MKPIFSIFNFLKGLKTTKFHDVPSGTAVKMYGKDADDNFVEDDVPSGGATAFTELSDVPQSYTDQSGKMLVVNEDENALEFTDVPSGGSLPAGTDGQTLRNNSGTWEANNIIENTATSNTYKAIEISDDSPSGAYKVRIRGHGSSVADSVPYIGMEFGNNLTISASSLSLRGRSSTGSSYGFVGLGSYFGATLGQFINIQGSSTTAIMAGPTFMLSGLTASKLVATNASKELVSTDLIALSGGSVVKMLTADATRESNT